MRKWDMDSSHIKKNSPPSPAEHANLRALEQMGVEPIIRIPSRAEPTAIGVSPPTDSGGMDATRKTILICAAVVVAGVASAIIFFARSIPNRPISSAEPIAAHAQGSSRQAGVTGQSPPESSDFTVLREEVKHDTPIRTQIEIDLLIKTKLSRDQILQLLRDKFNEAMSRENVFEKRATANCVVVSAYSTLEYYRAPNSSTTLAWIMQAPASDRPEIRFNDVVHAQMFKAPLRKHGLSEEMRRQIYMDYVGADFRAGRESREAFPTEPELTLSVGDEFRLADSLVLMGANNAKDWFAAGARSMTLPAGTKIEVLEIDQKTKYTLIMAYRPLEDIGFDGWVRSDFLGMQHPVRRDEDWLEKLVNLADARKQELKTGYVRQLMEEHAITNETLEAIRQEGDEMRWPY